MYKEKIITLIASRLSEANCERIWESVTAAILARESIASTFSPGEKYLSINKEWEEQLHPRENNGQFAPKGSGRAGGSRSGNRNARRKRGESDFGKTPTEYVGEEIKDFVTKFNEFIDARINFDNPWPWKRTHAYNHIDPDEYPPEKLLDEVIKHRESSGCFEDRVDEDGEYEASWADRAEELKARLQAVKKLDRGDDTKKERAKRVKEFYDCEDEIDEIEERWHDENDISGPLKFDKTEAGKKAKRRYAYLKRRRDALDREIDWDKVPEPETPKEQDGTPRYDDTERN